MTSKSFCLSYGVVAVDTDDGVNAEPTVNDLRTENIRRAADTVTSVGEPEFADVEPGNEPGNGLPLRELCADGHQAAGEAPRRFVNG